MLTKIILFGSIATLSTAVPQASPTPPPSAIPWSEKRTEFRSFLLNQPTQNATKALSGPSLRLTFPDAQCLELRFWNWNCFHDIPYSPLGVVAWFDSLELPANGMWDPYRFYTVGYYRDPWDGFGYYDNARMVFGSCGMRGPQSSCGTSFCVDREGKDSQGNVPEGESPYQDPNDRNQLCTWLRE